MAHKKIFSDGKLVIWSDGTVNIKGRRACRTAIPIMQSLDFEDDDPMTRMIRLDLSSCVVLSRREVALQSIENCDGCVPQASAVSWSELPSNRWKKVKFGDPHVAFLIRVSQVLEIDDLSFIVCLIKKTKRDHCQYALFPMDSADRILRMCFCP